MRSGRGKTSAHNRAEDTHVEIDTDAAGRRLLVLSDLEYPGWRAAIDGAPARIVRADRGLRGVALPAGRHRVTFTFAPRSVRIGAWLTLAGAAALVALAWTGRSRSSTR